jgi:hypothetical protein
LGFGPNGRVHVVRSTHTHAAQCSTRTCAQAAQGRFPQLGAHAGEASDSEGVWHSAQKQQIRNKIITGSTGVLAYWLLAASALTAKTRVSRLNTHNGATHRSKCPARTAAPLAGAGQCTGCIWATAGQLHATAGSQDEPTRPSICASQLLQA